jgi:hypothetical protein
LSRIIASKSVIQRGSSQTLLVTLKQLGEHYPTCCKCCALFLLSVCRQSSSRSSEGDHGSRQQKAGKTNDKTVRGLRKQQSVQLLHVAGLVIL